MASPSNDKPSAGPPSNDAAPPQGAAPDPLDDEVDVELEEDDGTPSGVEAAIERAAAGATDGDTTQDDVSAIGSQMAAESANGVSPPPPPPIVRPQAKPPTSAELRRRQMAKAKKDRQMRLKSTLVPIIAVVGLMLLAFGIYGVRVLTNDEDTRPNKNTMGLLMVLAGGPVGFMLLGGAAFFFVQVRQYHAQEAQELALDDQDRAAPGGPGSTSGARPLPKPRATK